MVAMMSRLTLYDATLVSMNSARSVFQVSYSTERLADGDSIEHTNGQEINNKSNDKEHNLQNSSPTIDDEVPCSPIPLFSRIRTVTVDYKGTMFCTCKHFE